MVNRKGHALLHFIDQTKMIKCALGVEKVPPAV
jgi:hypothetical protein